MKKSMLHRSFKPAKCKTALKLAVSRIKLLKNKRDAQVKVMKRELAQLLQSGQDRTARIRVEHVVMEEKIMTAYELIEIYCELIAARLPIIESQKNCPIDLKEAIASVVYASPRCADIPELTDVRKLLTAKYGKDFVSAALELHPDCGVSRMLAEKLSAKAPDGPTKIKILSGIAEEHNIKWDPKSFEETELKPPDDLLNGPNTFEKSTMMDGESPRVQTPSTHVGQASPSNYVPPGQHAERDAYSNLHQQNSGFSPHPQNIGPHVDAYNAMHHSSNPEARSPGTLVEGSEYRHSYSGGFEESPKTGHNWNMGFKDATAAAQAAAESAERASMAARAAAELSSRGQTTTQYTVDSQQSSINIRRNEVPQDSAGRNLQDELPSVPSHHRQNASQSSLDSLISYTGNRKEEPEDYADRKLRDEHSSGVHRSNNIHGNRNLGMQYDNSDKVELDNLAGGSARVHNDYDQTSNEPSGSATDKYSPTTFNDDPMGNPFWMEHDTLKDSYTPEKRDYVTGMQSAFKTAGNKDFLQQGIERQPSYVSYSSQSGAESENLLQQKNERQPSHVSYVSQSSNLSNDQNVMKPSNQSTWDHSGDKYSVDFDQDDYPERALEKGASGKKSITFDDSGSDDDGDYMYDMMRDHKGQRSNVLFSSGSRTPLTHVSEIEDCGSPYEYINHSPKASISESGFSVNQHASPLFSDSLTSPAIPSRPDDLPPAIFDDFDGSSSKEEEELKLSDSYSQKATSAEGVNYGSTGTSFIEEENSRSEGKQHFQSSSNSLDPFGAHCERYQGDQFNNEPKETVDSPIIISSRPLMSQRHSNELDGISCNNSARKTENVQNSTLESGKELNLGTLTGGLRNKGYRRAPYLKNSSGVSMDEQPIEIHSVRHKPSSSLPGVGTSSMSEAMHQDPYIIKEDLTSYKKPFDSDDDDNSDDEISKQTSNIKQQSYISKAGSGVRKSQGYKLRQARTFFDSDSDESVEDLSKHSLASKGHSAPAFSRRTKASQTSEKSSSKTTAKSSSSSLAPDSHSRPQYQIRNSDFSRKLPSSVNQAATPKSMPEYKIPVYHKNLAPSEKEQSTSTILKVTNRNLTPSEKEQSTSTIPKATSASSEGLKTSSSREKTLSRLDSTSSHVHPKLPDFDDFVAHMKSLHKNRE